VDGVPEKMPHQVPFRHLCNLLQIYNGDIDTVIGLLDDVQPEQVDRLKVRTKCAWNWIREFSPEDFRFSLTGSGVDILDLNEAELGAIKLLKNEIEKLDGALSDHVDLYLIGGGSMSFQNLKDATKDIDVVVRSENDMNLLKSALVRMGYSVPAIRGPYRQMQASAIMENKDGFRWDIFVSVVCGGLKLSDAMADRATNLFSMDRVSINMISLEDIFIFKSITSRERDREDMYLLFLQGLDFNQIRNEITWQNDNNMSAAWIAFFFNGLEEVVERYSIGIIKRGSGNGLQPERTKKDGLICFQTNLMKARESWKSFL